MKLSDLRPCDGCGGPIAPIFHLVTYTPAIIHAQHANEVLGLNQMFGGKSLALAEIMAPAADEAVIVASDRKPELKVTLFLCTDCYARKSVAHVLEAINDRKQENL